MLFAHHHVLLWCQSENVAGRTDTDSSTHDKCIQNFN